MDERPSAQFLVLSGCAINGREMLKSHSFKRSEIWGVFVSFFFFFFFLLLRVSCYESIKDKKI